MGPNEQNPYAAPSTPAAATQRLGNIPANDMAKIEAIVKDAGQFWLAIIMCFCCSAIGSLIIGPWYGVRLAQWSSMKNRYSQLLDPQSPPGSLQEVSVGVDQAGDWYRVRGGGVDREHCLPLTGTSWLESF